MKLLAIESSTDTAQVALRYNNVLLIKTVEGVREHSRTLLAIIDAILAEVGASPSTLDGVVFNRGPGSFTGLRVACALAQGMSYAQDIPLYPVSGLASIVTAVRKCYPSRPVLALMDARMQQMYWSLSMENQISEHERVDYPEAIQCRTLHLIIAGIGFEAYNSRFDASLQRSDHEWIEQGPCIESMITMVEQGIVASVLPKEAQPVYVRDKVT